MAVNPSENNPFLKTYDCGKTATGSVSSTDSVASVNSVVNASGKIVEDGNVGTSIESSGGLNDETYAQLLKDLQNKIDQKKQELSDTKKDRGWLSSIGNGISQVFGGGDSAKQKELENLEKQLNSLEKNPENISGVYKSIMGKDLDVKTINSLKESNQITNNLDQNSKNEIKKVLNEQYEELEKEFETSKKSNGWISGGWDKFKNWTGIGASSNKSQTQLDNMKKQLESIDKNPENLAAAYKNITGRDLNNEELTKLANGETSLKDASKAAESVNKYSEGQKMATDVFADVVSGVVAIAAIAAAPFTGGASLLLAAGVGAAVKVSLKASDCIGNEKKYGLKDLAYDGITGSINGLMAPVSNGLGGVVGTGVAKTLGLEAVESTAKTAIGQAAKTAGKEIVEETVEQTIKTAGKEVIEEGAKQSGKTLLENVLSKQGLSYVAKEGSETTAKTLFAKGASYGAEMAVDGSLSGATDGFARALGQGRIEDIPQDMVNGAIGGLVAAPLIGTGFRVAGKAGRKVGDKIDVIKKASKDAKINFKNVQTVENPDLELARNLGDFIKQAKTVVETSKAKNLEISNAFVESTNNLNAEIDNLVTSLKTSNESFNSLSKEYQDTLNETLKEITKGGDVSQKLLDLSNKVVSISEATQMKLSSASNNIGQNLDKILENSVNINEKANSMAKVFNKNVEDASSLAETGMNIINDIPNSNAYKQLGELPQNVKSMISSLKDDNATLTEKTNKLKSLLSKGVTKDNIDELTDCYKELEDFNIQLESKIQAAGEAASSSTIVNSGQILQNRYEKRTNSEMFSKLSKEKQQQALVEDTNIALSKFIQTMSSDETLPKDLQTFFKGFTSNCSVSRNMDQAQSLANELYGEGKYTLLQSFGAGTIGETYLAKDIAGKEVVIKMLKEGVTPEKFAEDRAMFTNYINEYITDEADKNYKTNLINGLFDSWDKELNFSLEAQGAKNMAKNAKRFDVAQTLEVGSKNGQNISLVMEKAKGVRLDTLIDMLKFYKENPGDYLTKSVLDDNGKELNPWMKNTQTIKDNPWLNNIEDWKKDVPVAYQKAQNEQAMFITKSGTKTVHADPHGGNVFVDIDANGKPKITYIDTGNTVQRTNAEVLKDIGLSLNMMTGNSKGVAEAMLEGATLPKGISKSEITKQFSDELDKRLFKAGVNLKNVNYTQSTINGILKDLNIIPNASNSNLIKATLQRVKTSRELFAVTDTQSNKLIDMKDLGIGVMKSFKLHPIETLKTIAPILKYAFDNDYDSLVVFLQMLQKSEPTN